MSQERNDHKIGIVEFFKGKTIFVTGSTGFAGKVFVEKLLRVVPTVQKIYLLIRANNEDSAKQRLKTEIVDSELFKVVRDKYGQSYDKFMWNKVVPIAGDLCKPYLGMNIELARMIRSEVNVIVHVGATTKWHERHDISFDVNVKAVSKLVDFATMCIKLVVFLHVSSVFATQNLKARVTLEKSIDLGHDRKTNDGLLSIEQLVNDEMRIISEVALRVHDEEERAQEMLMLGMHRSTFYKKYGNYLLTKTMGEMVVTKLGAKIPVVIIRPSQIESTFKEPFPGWIEGYKAFDPIILSYGTSKFKGLPANPSVILDMVPVDMVVNVMLTAIAKHGNQTKNGVNIYNVVSSLVNPLSCHDFFNMTRDYFASNPLKNSNGRNIVVKDIKYFESLIEFILVELKDEKSNAVFRSTLLRMAAMYEPILNFPGAWYDDRNTRELLEQMSLEELRMFNFNCKCINWKDYFHNIHIPGLLKRVVKNKLMVAKL